MSPSSPAAFTIRPAGPDDAPRILAFIRSLAEYEQLAHEVRADEAMVRDTLFGPRPAAEVVFGCENGTPVGFALFFPNYSTFLGRSGIYLEDLFVDPAHRGKGYGKALLAHLARLSVERSCGRLEWAVLHWNTPAIGFYERLGARPLTDWRVMRLTGEPLAALAAEAPPRSA